MAAHPGESSRGSMAIINGILSKIVHLLLYYSLQTKEKLKLSGKCFQVSHYILSKA